MSAPRARCSRKGKMAIQPLPWASSPLKLLATAAASRTHETPKPRLFETRALFARDVALAGHSDPRVDCKLRSAGLLALGVILGVFPSGRAVSKAFIALIDDFHLPPRLR